MNNSMLENQLGELSPKMLLLILGAIAGLTLLAGHLYIVKPSLARLSSLDVNGSEATVQSLEAETAAINLDIDVTQRELEEARTRLYGGPSDLPPEKVESYIVDRLDHISAQHAVELVSVKPGKAKQVLMFDELLYEVEVKGEFFALVAWLWELEQDLRPLVVNGFDIRPAARGAWVRMKLSLASYRPGGKLS